MKVGIYDVDSKIPNLALMKLSAYHKEQGDKVETYSPLFKNEYDKIYASKIFNFSDPSMLDDERMEIGGTGYDIKKNLPDHIENLVPDYSLYNFPHSIGFTQRGCRLRCDFCVVPEKKGKVKGVKTIDEIWTQRDSNFVILLDNDFFGNPEWRERIEEIKEYKLRVNFNQGLNIRNLKEEQAQALASVYFTNRKGTFRQVSFAWDDARHEKLIHKGIKICMEAGIKPYQMAFYVLIGYNSTPEEDYHRVQILKDYGCDPYVMPYDKSDNYQFHFQRYVNNRAIFNSVDWQDYAGSLKNKRISDPNQLEMAWI